MPLRRIAVISFTAAIQIWQSVQADEVNEADSIVRQYLIEVATEIGENPRSLGSQDAILRKFHQLGEQHLLKNKDALHKRAAADYLKLDSWTTPKNYEFKSRRTEMKKLEEMEEIFRKDGYGVPPFGRHTFATMWWEPSFAAKSLRELAFKMNLPKDDAEKRKFMEQFVAPRIYRQSDDPEQAVIAFFDGKELFVVRLVYTDVGIYALDKIEWFNVVVK